MVKPFKGKALNVLFVVNELTVLAVFVMSMVFLVPYSPSEGRSLCKFMF